MESESESESQSETESESESESESRVSCVNLRWAMKYQDKVKDSMLGIGLLSRVRKGCQMR